jgi:hypothetical protein
VRSIFTIFLRFQEEQKGVRYGGAKYDSCRLPTAIGTSIFEGPCSHYPVDSPAPWTNEMGIYGLSHWPIEPLLKVMDLEEEQENWVELVWIS